LTEGEAMALMTGRGYQEEGEAAGKWRRAQLTSTQLSTYYVGYSEISDLARDLRAADPGQSDQEIHDRMLAHGSPPVRLLRTLITA
jgi:DNA polymerase III delta subunit